MAEDFRDCIIFDIDGTLADNSHRQYHLKKTPKDWDSFNASMHLDVPVPAIAWLVMKLRRYMPIVICTGRQERDRGITQDWLNWHALPFTEMYMRADGDFRADDVVKLEMLNLIRARGWRPLFVVDDRNSVVAMWRREGLVCLQAAEGDF